MTDHLSPDVLARLAEHDWSHLTPEQRRHLVACARCRDALVEASGVAQAYAERPNHAAAPPDLTDRILARTSGRPRLHRARRWAWAAAALPAAAALVLMLLTAAPGGGPEPALLAPIQSALAIGSPEAMLFPDLAMGDGGESFRGGDADPSPLLATVQDLVADYRRDPRQARTAQWVVGGYLALDDLPSARLFADDALRHHPGDPRLLLAAGIVAYREGRLARADSLLMAALKSGDHDHLARYNLAVLQLEQGHRSQAVTVLRQLADAGHEPTGQRARELLQLLNN